jgi:hypothetical protein
VRRHAQFTTDGRRWWIELTADVLGDPDVDSIGERLNASAPFAAPPPTAPFRLASEEPWLRGKALYGRVRVTEGMAVDILVLCYLEIGRLMEIARSYSKPSELGLRALKRAREIQKIRNRVRGTMNEQGWPIPESEELERLAKIFDYGGG